MLKFFAQAFWRFLPSLIQIKVSSFFSRIFETRISAFFIPVYCYLFKLENSYLNQFQSESGQPYKSFQDFFRRKFKTTPVISSESIWPCEGYLCDWGIFTEKKDSLVKGQKLDLNEIFKSLPDTTQNHYFSNVFLHNHNYHRVHSPISGVITKITKIPGSLIFLRPWFYSRDTVSLPAFKNERLILQIKDLADRDWWLAFVGGFGVGTIEVSKKIHIGSEVLLGQELGQFNLGSTVCIASPIKQNINKSYLDNVNVGEAFQQ
jgi:phosphatidylserine decarboxylase